MKQQSITRINGVDIVTVEENGAILVPIKPICTALGINAKAQRDKIHQDETLESVGVLSTPTGADGKQYEMFCLPLKYIFGWLFTIQPDRVAPDAREAVINYRRECYDVLYDYFSGGARRQQEMNLMEQELLGRKESLFCEIKDHKGAIGACNKAIDKIDIQLRQLQTERLNPQPSLFN